LETLEMMAGEIGASVIVVKEVEIPAALAKLAAQNTGDHRRIYNGDEDDYSSSALSSFTNSDVDLNDEADDPSSTVILDSGAGHLPPVFLVDPDSDAEPVDPPRFAIDLEIASVYKPRPVRTKRHTHLVVGGKNKRGKKIKTAPTAVRQDVERHDDALDPKMTKTEARRLTRDRRREEKKIALAAREVQITSEPASMGTLDGESVISALENLQLLEGRARSAAAGNAADEGVPLISVVSDGQTADEDDDDVFPSTAGRQPYPQFPSGALAESHLDVDPSAVQLAGALSTSSPGTGSPSSLVGEPRLIVEALVVRKMSLDEAFLDFGGFAVM